MLYVTTHSTDRWYDPCILIEETPVKNIGELKLLADDDPSLQARLSGPLLRMRLFYVEKHHSVGIASNHKSIDLLPIIQ